MESVLYFSGFFAAGAALAGFAASLMERKRAGSRLKAMEFRLREMNENASRYREELVHSRQESDTLRRSLEKEKLDRQNALSGLQENYTRRAARLALTCSLAGVLAGGLLTGVYVDARARLHFMERMIDLEVTARTAKAGTELLGERLAELKKEYESMRRGFLNAREAEALTLAKLEILLNHLSGKKGRDALALDVEAMRENLRQDVRMEDSVRPDALPLQAVRL